MVQRAPALVMLLSETPSIRLPISAHTCYKGLPLLKPAALEAAGGHTCRSFAEQHKGAVSDVKCRDLHFGNFREF
jgi:hypothetical protein